MIYDRDVLESEVYSEEAERTFRVLVTGSRDWPSRAFVHHILNLVFCEIMELGKTMVLIHGHCPTGGDHFADEWAEEMQAIGFEVDVKRKPADWTRFKKAAGYRRNAEMVKLGADLCLAFIHNKSNGATHCAGLADKAGIETHEYTSKMLAA